LKFQFNLEDGGNEFSAGREEQVDVKTSQVATETFHIQRYSLIFEHVTSLYGLFLLLLLCEVMQSKQVNSKLEVSTCMSHSLRSEIDVEVR
jgi:hypothetical protein